MARRQLAALLLTLSLAACASPDGSPTSGSPRASVAPTASVAGLQPGRPYDATSVLQAMRESRRPDGVPETLQTEALAAAVAEQLWTFDGAAWPAVAIGGACGPTRCSLEVVGTPAGGAGSDLYTLAVDPGTGSVTVESNDLHGYPATLDAALKAAALAGAGDRLNGLAYTGARWLPPPDEGQFWVSYRSGGEEGSPGLDLLLELESGRVLELRPR